MHPIVWWGLFAFVSAYGTAHAETSPFPGHSVIQSQSQFPGLISCIHQFFLVRPHNASSAVRERTLTAMDGQDRTTDTTTPNSFLPSTANENPAADLGDLADPLA